MKIIALQPVKLRLKGLWMHQGLMGITYLLNPYLEKPIPYCRQMINRALQRDKNRISWASKWGLQFEALRDDPCCYGLSF